MESPAQRGFVPWQLQRAMAEEEVRRYMDGEDLLLKDSTFQPLLGPAPSCGPSAEKVPHVIPVPVDLEIAPLDREIEKDENDAENETHGVPDQCDHDRDQQSEQERDGDKGEEEYRENRFVVHALRRRASRRCERQHAFGARVAPRSGVRVRSARAPAPSRHAGRFPEPLGGRTDCGVG